MNPIRILIGVCLVLCAAPLWAKTVYTGRVVSVHDGDTVRVVDTDGRKRKIRLANIDAPELEQSYGKVSRDALRQAILDKTVQVEVYTTDRYQREVAVLTADNRDINRFQVASGNAWHYRSIARKQQDSRDFADYRRAEDEARQGKLGLWRGKSPTPPWQWRRNNRRAEQSWWRGWF